MQTINTQVENNQTKPGRGILGWVKNHKRTVGVLAAAGAVGGWALFRPDLLFVNRTVNESLSTAQGTGTNRPTLPVLLSQGAFQSLGHHTEGTAAVYQTPGDGHVLRLSNFRTSNGPDVRVYLVEGNNGKDDARIRKGGFLDLGVLKGNIGDQNYKLPANVDLSKYGSVSIWCKRFAVNFAAAPLQPQAANMEPSAAAATGDNRSNAAPITVTTGQFHKVAHRTTGTATITEDDNGKRMLRLSGFETAQGPKLRVYLVAAQDAKNNAVVTKADFVDLGALRSIRGTQTYAVPADIDLWKYLSVVIWCDQFDVNFGAAPLAAPQA